MPELIQVTDQGLHCAAGGFHIDPWRGVERALITHAHGDHARAGSKQYHAAVTSLGLLERRLGADARIEPHGFGVPIRFGDALVSFHPAGHVLGSAQIRIEVGGEVWVVSGDYKRDPDPSAETFQVVPCDTFITEATFALPIYRWPPAAQVVDELMGWWGACAREERTAVLFCYALGKAQRVLAEVALRSERPVHVHGAIETLLAPYRALGIRLPETRSVLEHDGRAGLAGELVIAPPSAFGSTWMRRFKDPSTAFVSGWMQVRGNRRRRGFDRGFVLSDHADWPGLLQTIHETGAKRVFATHGYSDTLARYLNEHGLEAAPLDTLYEGEAED